MKVEYYPVNKKKKIRWCEIRFVFRGLFLCCWEFIKLDCVKYKIAWLAILILYMIMMA